MIEFGGADCFPLIVPLAGRPFGAFKLELVSNAATVAFSEFQVCAQRGGGTLENIVLGRKASQSSVGAKRSAAREGVNGRAYAEPAAQTKREKSPWWKLEYKQLTEAQLVASIGGEPHARTLSRTNLRNGHRPKTASLPAGDIEATIRRPRLFSLANLGDSPTTRTLPNQN